MDLDLNCFQRASDGPCQQPWPKYINQVHWTTESQHCWQNYLHLDHYVIWSFKPFSTNPKTSSKPFKPLESFGFEKFKAFCQGSCAFFPFPRSRKTHGTLAQVLKTLSPGCMCVCCAWCEMSKDNYQWFWEQLEELRLSQDPKQVVSKVYRLL